MNDYYNREESPLATLMAAVGLLVVICLLAWLAIQFVRLVPSVFSRLAEVWDQNQQELADRTDDDNVVIIGETEGENESEEEETDSPEVEEAEEPTGSDNKPVVTPKPTTPKPQPVEWRTVTTYKTPVSDPNGYTDFQATYVAVGQMTNSDRFVPNTYLNEDERSALQFKVKNIGTKTSGEWRFIAELPDGSTITSLPQRPLGPSETATLTIAFDGVEGTKDRNIGATVSGGNDVNLSNNGFKVRVDVK